MSETVPTSSERRHKEGDFFLIEHPVTLEALYWNPQFSDVSFVVEGERFRAHKLVLATRCEYFRAMLYGGLKESSKAEIQLKGTSTLAFRTLLKYIYTGRVELTAFNFEQLLAILHLAHEYGLIDIQRPIVDYLKEKLDIKNVFAVLRTSPLLFNDLTESCLQLADKHASYVLASEGFLTLPQNAVVELLSRNSFHAAEIDVFKAICRWIRAQPCMKVITLIAIHWSRNNPALIRELLRQCYLNASYRRSAFGSISYIQRSFWPQSETRSFSQRNALEKLVRNVLDLLYQAIVSDMCGSLALNENMATVEPEGIIGELGLPYTITELEIRDCDIDTTSEEGEEKEEEYYYDDDYCDDDDDLQELEDTFWYKIEKKRKKKKKKWEQDDAYWCKIETTSGEEEREKEGEEEEEGEEDEVEEDELGHEHTIYRYQIEVHPHVIQPQRGKKRLFLTGQLRGALLIGKCKNLQQYRIRAALSKCRGF